MIGNLNLKSIQIAMYRMIFTLAKSADISIIRCRNLNLKSVQIAMFRMKFTFTRSADISTNRTRNWDDQSHKHQDYHNYPVYPHESFFTNHSYVEEWRWEIS